MAELVTLGESLGLLRALPPDAVELAATLRLGVAGAESNVAIGASRLGAQAVWIGRVGDDDVGRRILRELRAEGVRVHAAIDPEAPSALLIKETPPRGPARVRYYRRGMAGSRLAPEDVPRESIERAGLLHVTGITPSLSPSAEAAVALAVELAVEAGVPVSFDVNHRATLPRHRPAAELYLELARRATVLFAGDDEARLLVPEAADEEGLLAGLAELGPREVVLKLGDRGCLARIDGERLELPAVPVTVVDTVGAGDAFVAGYLAERLAGAAAADRLRTAVACGAAACTHPGDWEGSPRRAELAAAARGGDPVLR
ncbi:sugar kinase [Homoserinibacter sp. YIM 151385]|uniref:sugar kinase n=1 Tax=Homoserinibacter sp. YIM 151385 TaxID=2985506 RepID=UPI0022F0A420|nr:sugar kinase [Homoserinibacter sp. YIM 151385]WBU37513.1 sugar kinase [Homoserinibacter sp. YIM 151385]